MTRDYPLGPRQQEILATIQQAPGLGISEYARRLGVQANVVQRAVTRLEREGLLHTELHALNRTTRICWPESAKERA